MSDVADAIIDQRSCVNKAVLIDRKLWIWSERIQRMVNSLGKVDDNCTENVQLAVKLSVTLFTATELNKKYNRNNSNILQFSQLPVWLGGRVVGTLDL